MPRWLAWRLPVWRAKCWQYVASSRILSWRAAAHAAPQEGQPGKRSGRGSDPLSRRVVTDGSWVIITPARLQTGVRARRAEEEEKEQQQTLRMTRIQALTPQ